MRKLVDFVYISMLVVVGSGIVTLCLSGLYSWYVTGAFPLAAGARGPWAAGEEAARFYVGSVYVPIFVAFAGIAIAHRLKNSASYPPRSPMSDQCHTVEMTWGGSSYIPETLARPGAAQADRGPHERDRAAGVENEDVATAAQDRAATADGDRILATDQDDGGTAAEEGVGAAANEDAGMTAKEDIATAAQDRDPSLRRRCGNCDADNSPANDFCGKCGTRLTADQAAGPREAKKDFLEQLKDPANREKLAAILASIDV